MKIHIKFHLLLAILLTSSCGTINKHHNVVKIDSSPRHLEIHSEDNQESKYTPSFFKISPAWNQNITLSANYKENVGSVKSPKLINRKLERSLNYSCGLNWSQSLIPDAIIMAIFPYGTVAGGIMLGVDFLTGGAYRCEDNLLLKYPSLANVKSNRPKRILVIPPATTDENFSDNIFKSWRKSLFAKFKNKNDIILNYSKTKSDLDFVAINFIKSKRFSNVEQKTILDLCHKHKPTHILFLQVDHSKDLTKVSPKLYDAFTFIETKSKMSQQFKMKTPENVKSTVISTLISAFHILPNSFKLGYSVRPVVTIKDSSEYYETRRHPDVIPNYFTIFGLESTTPPHFFDPWDYTLQFSPSLFSSSWEDHNVNSDYTIKLQSYSLFYDVDLVLFSPFGQYTIGVGLGVQYYSGADNKGQSFSQWKTSTKMNFSYRYFITRRVYFKLGSNYIHPHGDYNAINRYNVDDITELYFGGGYYFPEFKSFLRKLVPL